MPIPAEFQELVDPAQDGGWTTPPYQPEHWQRTQVFIESNDGHRLHVTDRPNRHRPGYFLQSGPDGWDLPRFDLKFEESPNLDGGYFRSVRATTREMALPVYIYGSDRRGVIDLKRQLLNAMNPKNGPVRIVAREANGSTRSITAYYVSGMEGNESRETSGFTWIKYVVVVRAMEPYWTSGAPESHAWFMNPERHWFLTNKKDHLKFIPIRVSDGLISSPRNEIPVDADVETWPVWEIYGPISGKIAFTNETSGKSLTFGPSFGLASDNDRIVIDTRPGTKTIIKQHYQGGEWIDDPKPNWWNRLGENPQLWPLVPGMNLVSVEGQGAVGVTTRIVCTYRKRYFSYAG